MRYREFSESRKRQLRYGALALALVVLVAGVILVSRGGQQTNVATATDGGSSTRQGAAATAKSTPAQAATSGSTDDVSVVNGLKRDEAVALIGDARRQASAGDFAAADASLQKAEKAVPHLAETAQARQDIQTMQSPDGLLAVQLQHARLAIEHDDTAAAEVAIDKAAQIKPDAPEIAELKSALKRSQEKATQREARIGEALAHMRDAVARRDFAAADSALNAAERIDIQSPAIRSARAELARARGESGQPQ